MSSTKIEYLRKEELATVWAQIVANFLPLSGGTISGTLTVTGATTLTSLSVTNNASVGGNLGIGISDPNAKLHVYGNTLLQASTSDTPLQLCGDAYGCYTKYNYYDGSTIGYLGIRTANGPVFYDNKEHGLWYTDRSDIVIDTHGEGSNTVILDGANELGGFYDRGGTCSAYEVSANTTDFTPAILTPTGTELSPLPASTFNGLVGYRGISYNGEDYAVYDLVLPDNYFYTSNFYWSFGNNAWSPTRIRVLTAHSDSDYTLKYTSDACPAYGQCSVDNAQSGFNRLRIVVNKYTRLACFGIKNYVTTGLNTTYMNRCQDDGVYRSISPARNNVYNLGSSSYQWNDIYSANVISHGATFFGGRHQFGRGSGASEINYNTYSLYVGTETTRTGNLSEYSSGIAFCHGMNYSGSDALIDSPQAWVGLRLEDTANSERSSLVFATKSGTGTTGTGNDIPIERMCITPNGSIGIGTTSPTSTLQVNGITRLVAPSNQDTPILLNGSASGSYVGFCDNSGSVLGYLGVLTTGPVFYDSTNRTIWHSGNSNLSTVSWTCNDLIAAGAISEGGVLISSKYTYTAGSYISISSNAISANKATSSQGGVVTTSAQNFAGVKTFLNTGDQQVVLKYNGSGNSHIGLGFANTDGVKSEIYVSANNADSPYYKVTNGTGYKMWHAGNSNLSTVDWTCKILSVSSNATIGGSLSAGASTLASLGVTGNTTMSGTLSVAENITGSKNIQANGGVAARGIVDLSSTFTEGFMNKFSVSTVTMSGNNVIINRYTDAPTYQLVDVGEASSVSVKNTLPSGLSEFYGYPRYMRIYNSKSSAVTVTVGWNVVCEYDHVSLPAGSYVEIMFFHPSSSDNWTVKWSPIMNLQ